VSSLRTRVPSTGVICLPPSWVGQTVEIRAWKPKRKRSLDQNAYLHAEPFPKLAKQWGESIARTKLICMVVFWGTEPCKLTGTHLPVKAHTSDMTVEECTLFIDWLIPWAITEHGVDVTAPDEWRDEEAA
jgi:hypothetical protein